MPPAGMRRRVNAIPGTPLPNGILGGCSTVIDVTDDDIHQLLGVEWLAMGCCPVHSTDWCPPDESPGLPAGKEFCRPENEHADAVTLYAGIECSTIGWSYEEAVEHVRQALLLGEQRGLEEWFWTHVIAPEAVDLTPAAGPVSIAQGVAALEGCLAESYGGVGVLHIPTGAAALLGCCNIAHLQGSQIRTLAGNCVVLGAGYSALNTGPDGVPAEPGTAWLAITGPLQIRRGPLDIVPDRAGASVDYRFNDRRVLAERTYVPATTCVTCMIQIEVCP
ncbi:hypothetical protein [Nonomuraea sp. NPDC049646]|uniref:hypothetical protein n=1 Tax=unclassified Nonomuraea TaxID=2593643 RepID=UPI003789ACD7